MKSPLLLSTLTLACAALTGCSSLGQSYQAPTPAQLQVPAQWHVALEQASAVRAQAWWTALADPALNQLVEKALEQHPTVAAAQASLSLARAAQGQTLAQGHPQVNATQQVQRVKQGLEPVALASTSLNFAWEVDLFGAVAQARSAAQARVEEQQAALADAHVSLSAAVVEVYASYRQCLGSVALTQQDLAAREAVAQLTGLKAEAGFVAPYLAARAQATAAEGRSALADAQAQCQRSRHLLRQLSGLNLTELEALLGTQTDIPQPSRLDVSLPEQVLASRPDLLKAERALAAAAADVGLAQANRYPRLQLNAGLGYQASNTGPGTLSLGLWSIGPSLSLPLWDGGSRRAQAEQAQARYELARAQYRQAVALAMQEVDDALSRYAAAVERLAHARQAETLHQQSFQAMDARYREGVASLLELEDARRSLLAAQQSYCTLRLEQLKAWTALHRATGGGFLNSAF